MDIDKLNQLVDRNALRKRPLRSREVMSFIDTIEYKNLPWNSIHKDYLTTFDKWIHDHKLIEFNGLDKFETRKVTLGVTHAINDLHMLNAGRVVIFDGEFFYHQTLFPNIKVKNIKELQDGDVLLISTPFCGEGYNVHPHMTDILATCLAKNIPVHIDAAWYPCSRDVRFNVDHPAIHSVNFSLSKAYGISEHRCGIQYSRQPMGGHIDYMNDEDSHPAINNMYTGIKCMNKFGVDYFWNKYDEHYKTIINECKNLAPSPAIHVAFSTDNNGKILRAVPTKAAIEYLDSISQN